MASIGSNHSNLPAVEIKKGPDKPSGERRRRESTSLPQPKADFQSYEGAIGNAWQSQPRQQLGTIGSVHRSTRSDQIRRQNGSSTPNIHGQISIATPLQGSNNKDPGPACTSTTGTLELSERLVNRNEQEILVTKSNKILLRTGQHLRAV
jgi:hypothetical protein